jgi:uncharacterized protein (TIGR02246 family)
MMRTMGENEARASYDRLIAGWNDHDGEAMADPFAPDGVVTARKVFSRSS